MKKAFFVFEVVAIAIFVMQVFAADQQTMAVKHVFKANGVVIVTGSRDSKPVELQCNVEMPNCKSPDPGNYVMVELPKNHGIYMDCVNVDLYRTTNTGEVGEAMGQYCLMK